MSAVFASGAGWVGKGVRSIESGLHDLFDSAERRLVATAYSISSGAFDLPPTWIEAAIVRHVQVILVVNRAGKQHPSAVSRLLSISRSSGGLFQLYDFRGGDNSDLHAKVVVADERTALIGSSNLSRRGLLDNYEMAFKVEGASAGRMADMVLRLTTSQFSDQML